MKPFNLLTVAILTSMAISITGCPDKSTPPQEVNKTFFVKGDPRKLIAGATLEPSSPINEDNIQDWGNFYLYSLVGFAEREKVETEKKRDLEKENAPSKNSVPKVTSSLKLTPVRDSGGQWRLETLDGMLVMNLKKEKDGSLQIENVGSRSGEDESVDVLHWSVAKDGTFASVLLSFKNRTQGRGLVVIYFAKPTSNKSIPTTNPKYKYTAGAGVKIGWSVTGDQPVELQLCGSATETERTRNAVEAWTQHLDQRLNVKFSQTDTFYPFSDLNQHCIYLTDSYIYEQNNNIVAYGITISVPNYSSAQIMDADVIMFKEELEKLVRVANDLGVSESSTQRIIDRQYKIALVHEIGHWFGLAHQFDKDVRSVMSYKIEDDTPQPYDIEALQELYPRVLND